MNFPQKRRLAFPILDTIPLVVVLLLLALLNGCKKEETVISGNGSDDLTNPSILPRISSTVPSGGTVGPFKLYNRGEGNYKPHFVLVFNKLMYKFSFTSRSVIVKGFDRPVIARLQQYYYPIFRKTTSSASDFYDNVLSFNIVDSLGNYPYMMFYRIGQNYTIIVDSTIEDINGNHPTGRASFSFTPEPYFRVVSSFPTDGTTDAGLYTSPGIAFNSPIDNTIIPSLGLTPLPAGSWKLDNYDSLVVYYMVTGGTLRYNTHYTLTVSANAHDAENRPVNHDYTSTFTTIPFRVTSTYPYDRQTKTWLNQNIYVYLSGVMDTSTFRSAFSINPSVPGGFPVFYPPASSFNYYIPGSLRQSTMYTVSLSSALKATDGTALEPKTFTFTTDRFKISSTYPSDGSSNVYKYSTIQVYFNGRIDTGSVRSAFSISRALPGSFGLYEGNDNFSFYHNGFASKTTYTVTISTGMRTKAGDNLTSPYAFSFTSEL